MKLTACLLVAIVVAVPVFAAAGDDIADLRQQAMSLYCGHRLAEALPLFEQVAAEKGGTADDLAQLAETYRRLGDKERAGKTAGKALAHDSCNSFALTVLANICLPSPWAKRADSDSAWVLVNMALRCDSTDGNGWITLWGEAIIREKFDQMRLAERKLAETGFLTPTVRAYARWMLAALPKDAILITSGDMDTYPPRALQQTEGFRTDVLVIEQGLMNLAPFLRHLQRDYGFPLTYDDFLLDSLTADGGAYSMEPSLSQREFLNLLVLKRSGDLIRPLAVAVTVDPAYYADGAGEFRSCGPCLLWQPPDQSTALDTAMCRASFDAVKPDDFAGAWVSSRDHSSVRQAYTRGLGENIAEAALAYCERMRRDSRRDELTRMLDWLKAFESRAQLDKTHADEIKRLREAARR